MKLLVYLCSIFVTLRSVNGEVYTALVDLKEVLQTESVLLDTLEKYISAEQQKLDLLHR